MRITKAQWAWIIIAFIVLALAAAFLIYAEDYYHASEGALEGTEAGSVKPDYNAGVLEYVPQGAETGFVFYPGGKVEFSAYAALCDAIAEKGVAVFIPRMPFNLAVFNINSADEIMARYPEIKNWYIGGHSLGGAMAAVYAESHAESLEGLVLLGAYSTSDLKDSGLKVLTVYGSQDKVLNREKYDKYRSNLPEDTVEIVIDGGCHSFFGDYGMQAGDGTPSITRKDQQERTVSAFLDLAA